MQYLKIIFAAKYSENRLISIDELIKYMHKTTEAGTYYLYVLKYMDDDDSEFKGKIIYEREDGTEKTLFEDSAIRIWDLFTKRDY